MKAVKFSVAGRTVYLAYNGNAMFKVRDEFGGTSELMERTMMDTQEGWRDTCRAAAILIEQGELIRRHMGYTPERIPDEKALMCLLSPQELVELKKAIPTAISLGFGREVTEQDGDEVIDLGLAEINEKKRTF